MNHTLAISVMTKMVVELISKKYCVSLDDARDMFYMSNTKTLLNDDETGLYGESPLYVFSLFEKEHKDKRVSS